MRYIMISGYNLRNDFCWCYNNDFSSISDMTLITCEAKIFDCETM